MRNRWIGGGLLGAIVVALGAVVLMSQGTTPKAEAQTSCDEDVNCVVVTKEADDDAEFSFSTSDGERQIGTGESFAVEASDDSASISEDETEGWTLAGIDCDEPDGVEVTIDEDNASVDVEFNLDEGEFATVECTFTNEMDEEPEETATSTATATATATEEADDEDDDTTPTATSTTTSQSASTPVVPTPIAPTPRPAATIEAAGVISPPSTGSGGLK